MAKFIEKETGTRVPWSGSAVSLDRFFQSAELRDVLDAITLISEFLRLAGIVPARNSWVTFVRRVLSEERTTYALDKAGSVQFAVDPSYATSRVEVIAGLSHERWALARQEVEHSFQEMDVSPKNTNSAIRSMAAAVESIAKDIIGNGVPRVGSSEIERNLWPMLERKYIHDEHAKNAGHAVLKSYSDWVNVTHQYRHGQSTVDGSVASEALAIWVIVSGASIIRWLISELS